MNVVKLNELIAAVTLQDVRLVDSAASASIRETQEGEQVSITVSRHAKVAGPPSEGKFHVLAALRAKVEGRNKEKALVSVRATFELAYQLPVAFRVSEDDLKAFAETNGVFNAWPYWREFLQSIVQRMGLPPIVLPLMTMKQIVSNLNEGRSAPTAPPQKEAAAG